MTTLGDRSGKPASMSALRGFDREEFVRARRDADMTVQELGRRSGIDRAAIHRWENGECLPIVDSLSMAAAALGQPLERFVNIPEPLRTLADLRMLAGLTQAKLAESTGISRKVLGQLERGRSVLDDERVASLASALKVSEAHVREAHRRSFVSE